MASKAPGEVSSEIFCPQGLRRAALCHLSESRYIKRAKSCPAGFLAMAYGHKGTLLRRPGSSKLKPEPNYTNKLKRGRPSMGGTESRRPSELPVRGQLGPRYRGSNYYAP
eukprot:CAMPEP_0170573826 /NCGR_PEP_ID=MMETSP0224-20130122/2973_1 /TAXON_ID=285029 /ORGANISM="Togula jolla, Strain CCCM 725" /LENGTH=109 /DNA_ID=CAMNT_0010896441 /DNA_START=30 /DNA_END=359 /DNA_ORIENTATION=-